MLARFSLGEDHVADRIERAVAETLLRGPRTAELAVDGSVSTNTFAAVVASRLESPVAAA